MTWLSRLLPQSPRLPRLADHNHRTRQAQRRRRMSTLETLEGRTLLSNVVLTYSTAANGQKTLIITGDTHNDTFTVSDNNATGVVTVTGNHSTLINSSSLPATSKPVSEIAIILPGNHNSTDNVTLTSTGSGQGTIANISIVAPGVTTPGVAGLDLTLNVTSLTLTGELSLWDAPTFTGTSAPSPSLPIVATASHGHTAANAPTTAQIPGYTPPTVPVTPPTTPPTTTLNNNLGGILTMNVTGSHLGTLYVEQDGCCLANVTLNHDAISGSVIVEEGVANGDTITLENSTAGATTLIQGYGPTMAGCNGTGDLVNVQDDGTATNGIFDLAITQLGAGGGATILVGASDTSLGIVGSEVEVALAGFGIEATQNDLANFDFNTIAIESITTYTVRGSSSPFGLVGPPDIVAVQGDGSVDSITIDNATIPGNIIAVQGAGDFDSVALNVDVAGYTTPLVPGSNVLIPHGGFVGIFQGNGFSDTVFLSSTGSEGDGLNVFNELLIIQGNGGSDIVTVDSTVAVTGFIVVVQGNGAGDQVYITSSTAGYVLPVGPFGGLKDYGGLLAVVQGNGYEDGINITSVGLEGDFGSVFNNVLLIQGASTNGNSAVCTQSTGDTAEIDETVIWDNLLIFQNARFSFDEFAVGSPSGVMGLPTTLQNLASATPATLKSLAITDGPGLGNNVVSIGDGLAVNSAGVATGAATTTTTSPIDVSGFGVYVGEETFIFQGGANNQVLLGGAGIGPGLDFSTGFLDIWTGAGGGGFVSAENTAVAYGSFFGLDYVIDGGGDGNTYSDLGGNSIGGVDGTLPYNTSDYSS